MRQSSKQTGLMIAALWLACIVSVALAMIGGGLLGAQRHGGVIPAYSTLSSGYWFGFTQTAGVPASATAQVYYSQTATAGAPASATGEVYYNQTSTAGAPVSQTADVYWRQTGTASYNPEQTAQAHWVETVTAGAP